MPSPTKEGNLLTPDPPTSNPERASVISDKRDPSFLRQDPVPNAMVKEPTTADALPPNPTPSDLERGRPTPKHETPTEAVTEQTSFTGPSSKRKVSNHIAKSAASSVASVSGALRRIL